MSLGDILELKRVQRSRIVRAVAPYLVTILVYHVAASLVYLLLRQTFLRNLELPVVVLLVLLAVASVLSLIAEARISLVCGMLSDLIPLIAGGVVLHTLSNMISGYEIPYYFIELVQYCAIIVICSIPIVAVSTFNMFIKNSSIRMLTYFTAAAPLIFIIYKISTRMIPQFSTIIPISYGLSILATASAATSSSKDRKVRIIYVSIMLAFSILVLIMYFLVFRNLLLHYALLRKFSLYIDAGVIGLVVLLCGLAMSSLVSHSEETVLVEELLYRIYQRLQPAGDYLLNTVHRFILEFVNSGKKEGLYKLIVRVGRSLKIPDICVDRAVELVEAYADVPQGMLLSVWQRAIVDRLNKVRRVVLAYAVLKSLQCLPVTSEDLTIIKGDIRTILRRSRSFTILTGQVLAIASLVLLILVPVCIFLFHMFSLLSLLPPCVLLMIHLSYYIPSPTHSILQEIDKLCRGIGVERV